MLGHRSTLWAMDPLNMVSDCSTQRIPGGSQGIELKQRENLWESTAAVPLGTFEVSQNAAPQVLMHS